VAEVFGHGPDQLYRLDPKTKQITTVGSFSGCEGSIIDLAIDEDGVMVGSTFDALYFIDKATAACTLIAYGSYPNSLSFVPKGTLEPDHEVLVGYVDDEYVRIDTVTGALSTVGYLSNGLASSGDVVSVIDGKTFLTVKGAGCDTDCLVEVSPTTGDLVTDYGETGYSQVFGLAFWGGSVYGFTNGGELFEIELGPGGLVTTPVPFPSAPAGLQFYGAGSSTDVPLVPPPA
jgi:hypothetical protein